MIIAMRRLAIVTVCGMLCVAGGSAGAQTQLGPDGRPAPPGAVGNLGGAPPPTPDPVVASIEGQAIHMSEVMDEIRGLPAGKGSGAFAALYPMALDRLIQRQAMVLRAHAEGMGEEPEILRHIQEAADRVLEEAYLERITARSVSEQSLLDRYDQEVRGKPGPEEVHGWAILLPTEAEAQEVIAKLAAGGDFPTLARQFSKDATATVGGDMGLVQRASLSPEVGAVLFELQPGQVTPYPVRTAVGWFVLKATARQLAPTPTFAEAHDRLQAEAQRAEVAAAVQAALRQAQVQTYDADGSVTTKPAKNNDSAAGIGR